jgi:hypothetical protein
LGKGDCEVELWAAFAQKGFFRMNMWLRII